MFFKGIPLFTGLSEANHGLLLQVAVRKSYPRHSLLVQEGDPGERFYLLRRGRAKVYLGNEEGREVILAILGPGELFGDMNLFDQLPRSATAHVLAETRVLSLDQGKLRGLILSYPELALGLLAALAAADHRERPCR